MAIKIHCDRGQYVEAVKAIGESIARRAEEIVPSNLRAATDIKIVGEVAPGAITMFSWTINAFAEDEDGRPVAIIDEVEE